MFKPKNLLAALFLGLMTLAPGAAADGLSKPAPLADLCEWVLQVPLTEAQRQSFAQLASSLPAPRLAQMNADEQRLRAANPQQRDSLRAELRGHLLAGSDALASWAQQTESTSGLVLVAGDPALTNQSMAAFGEWLLFAVDPENPPVVSAQLAQILDKAVEDLYPTLDAAQRTQLAQLPLNWASLRKQWPALETAQREQLQAKWRAQLGPVFQRQSKLQLARLALDQCLLTLQNGEPGDLDPKLARLQFLANGLRQEKDPQCSQAASQLELVIADIQRGQQQQASIDAINKVSDEITARSQLPGIDSASLKPMFFGPRGGLFVGDGSGMPYRY